MKRATKILTLILIVVFVFAVFASCDLLVGKDVAKYRKQVAMKVGNEEVTVGKLLDTFNSYYNNYYYYVSAGYITIDDLVGMVVSSLSQQYMQIDDYVTRHKNDQDVKNSELVGKAHNAEFLTPEEFEYCIKYVTHVTFTTFDSSLEEQISAKYDLADAKTEDTSRDFTEYDDLDGYSTYAEYYLRHQNFNSEDADEYFDDYYQGFVFGDTVEVNKYVYSDEEVAAKKLQEYNDRLEDDSEEITFDDLVSFQEKVLNQYKDTVKSNYGITLDTFMKGQVDDMVSSCIMAKWSYEAYEGLDQEEDFQDILKERFDLEKNKQIADFNENDQAFDSFIKSLSSSSYIFDVPEAHEKEYVFVKNILVPFTTAQSNRLSALANRLGDTERAEYLAARNAEAAKILADYFDSDKYDDSFEALFDGFLTETEDEDSDRKYEKLSDLFEVKDGKVTINANGALAPFFDTANNTVNKQGDLSESETIVELMKRFNTDVGQHTSQYDYVVYVGEDWEDYNHSWVKEFYTAVNELRSNPEGDFDGVGKYAICVSTYGVHIIYVEGFVEDSDQVFSQLDDSSFSQSTDPKSTYYRWFVSNFTTEMQNRTQDKLDALEKEYLKDNKIQITKEFDKFLRENNFTFDFDAYLEEQKSEHDD